jgi:hypothetical protein
VCLASLTVAGESDVRETPLRPEVLEARHDVRLEVVPTQTKLLLLVGHCCEQLIICFLIIIKSSCSVVERK